MFRIDPEVIDYIKEQKQDFITVKMIRKGSG